MTRSIAVIPLLVALGLSAFAEDPKPDNPKESDEMDMRTYRVPQSFLTEVDTSNKEGERKPKDGLRLIPSKTARTYDATESLKTYGVLFPPGSFAIYYKNAQALMVRNTQQNLDLIDTLYDQGGMEPRQLEAEFSVIECALPADQSLAFAFHPTYSQVEHLPAKSIRLLDRVSVLTKSGQRATAKHVTHSLSGKPDTVAVDPNRDPPATGFENGEFGTKVEVEPVIAADGKTIDCNVVYRFRKQPEGKNDKGTTEIHFTTSFCFWSEYPLVIHVSSESNQNGKFMVVVACEHVINPGGWKLNRIEQPADGTPSPSAKK